MCDEERKQLFETVKFTEPTIREEVLDDNHSVFTMEPLIRGYGMTMGNSLRRVLLNSIPGAAVVCIHIDGVVHEFSSIPNVREDVTEIILNIKKISAIFYGNAPKQARIAMVGPCEVTAGDIQGGSDLEIVNPEQHIATLDEGAVLHMELTFDRGIGYQSGDQNKEKYHIGRSGDIYTDSIFTPVPKVSYTVDTARVGGSMDYDKLTLDVYTDGSISPADSVALASKILIGHYGLVAAALGDNSGNELFIPSVDSSADHDLNRSIDELEFSVRSYNCLRRAGINTVQDLTQVTEEDMLKVRNLGKKSFEEIRDKLKALGLGFREE